MKNTFLLVKRLACVGVISISIGMLLCLHGFGQGTTETAGGGGTAPVVPNFLRRDRNDSTSYTLTMTGAVVRGSGTINSLVATNALVPGTLTATNIVVDTLLVRLVGNVTNLYLRSTANFGGYGATNALAGTKADHVATVGQMNETNALYLPLAGGTMSGVINDGGSSITNVLNLIGASSGMVTNYDSIYFSLDAGGTFAHGLRGVRDGGNELSFRVDGNGGAQNLGLVHCKDGFQGQSARFGATTPGEAWPIAAFGDLTTLLCIQWATNNPALIIREQNIATTNLVEVQQFNSNKLFKVSRSNLSILPLGTKFTIVGDADAPIKGAWAFNSALVGTSTNIQLLQYDGANWMTNSTFTSTF